MTAVVSKFGDTYKSLFMNYVEELDQARTFALAWWNNLLTMEARSVGEENAEIEVQKRWPFGPTSHPRVLAVYRKYFIACERVNEAFIAQEPFAMNEVAIASEDDWGANNDDYDESNGNKEDAFWKNIGPIDPPLFLVEFLSGRRDDLCDFLAYLVFSPIGEENNRSV